MHHLKKHCRSEHFMHMWNSLGGVVGLLALMATMSVRDVDILCRCFGKCKSFNDLEGLRERQFSSLYKTLLNTDGKDLARLRNPDSRPLLFHYNKILPACEPKTAFEAANKGIKIKKITWRAHAETYQDLFIATIFPPRGKGKKITPFKFVLESNSIYLSIRTLVMMASNPASLEVNADNIIEDLVKPLARRLCNSRAKERLQTNFYNTLVRCINMEPGIADKLDYPIISYAIRAWSRTHNKARRMMSHLLETLICLMPKEYQWTLDRIANELSHVEIPLRFQLLSLLLQNARPFEIDIELFSRGGSEALRSLSYLWPPRLFYLLPSGISLRLFKLLGKVHPDGNFIAADETYGIETVMRCSDYGKNQSGDVDMLSALLHSRHHKNDPRDTRWRIATQRILQDREYKAMSAQDANERAKWAQSAIHLSIASGSLSLYEDTLYWARRFNGDAVVTKRLFSKDTLLTQEGLDILSGVPRAIVKHDTSLVRLKEDVERANRIILLYAEMLATFLQNPSCGLGDAHHVRRLPSKVIFQREKRLQSLMDSVGLSENEIYSAVWEPSIAMLLHVERFELKGGHVPLDSMRPRGLLKQQSFPGKPKSHFYKFLDKLGEFRDRLWQEYREGVHPILAYIEAPWPKGLPIQYLVHSMPTTWKHPMPYLESRAESILFAPRENLLSPVSLEKEAQEAVGPFVEDFIFALSVFVSLVDAGPERDDRILRIWNHAVENLTSDHIPKERAIWY
ncbi:hypothetical protein F4804DRAFT_63782 [Jackrogersella minutella]|nr:hypothetical protein F4804DRAFT_63782 [Jackrogersella minutella]